MSTIKFLMDFAKQGDLKGTIEDLKAINSELVKNKSLQKQFGDTFTQSTKSISTQFDEITQKTKKYHDALKVTSDPKEIARLTAEIEKQRVAYENLGKTTHDVLINNKKLQQEEAKTRQENAKAMRLENKLRDDSIKKQKQEEKEKDKLNSKYAMMSARLNQLRKDYKDMALSEQASSKEARRLLNEITALDTKLKNVDASVGQFQRNVGNYGSGLAKFGNQLKMILGIGSAIMIAQRTLSNATGIVIDYEQANANLASVLGKNREEIQALTNDSIRLGSATSFTASEVASLQTEYAKLGFTEQEILKATEATLDLAAATNTELPRAAEVAGATLRGFSLDASEMGRVTDVMAKSFSTSALDMEKFAESMKYVAPIAASAGFSIEEVTAMLGKLADNGISGSQAGTSLRRVLSELAKTGLPLSEALQQVAKDGITLADAEDEVGRNAQTALVVLAKSKKGIDDLTQTYKNANGAAKEMAETQLDTLGGDLKLLQSAWEGYILKMNEASGSSSDFRKAIQWLTKNLDTILDTLIKVIKIYGTFKAVQLSSLAIMKAHSVVMATAGSAMTLFGKSTDGATKSFKNLDASMKANVIALVVTTVYQLADALGFFESEADRIAARLENQQKRAQLITNIFEAKNQKQKQSFEERKKLLEQEYNYEKGLAEASQKSTKEIDEKYTKERLNIASTFRDERTLEAAKTRDRLAEIEKEITKNLAEQTLNRVAARQTGANRSQLDPQLNRLKSFEDDLKVERMALKTSLEQQIEDRKNAIAEIEDLSNSNKISEISNITEISKEQEAANKRASDAWKRRLEQEQQYLDDRLNKNKDYYRKLKELEADNIVDEEAKEIEKERLRNKFAQQDIENYFKTEEEKIKALSPQSATEQEKLRMIEENKMLEAQLIIETEENTQNKILAIRKKFEDKNIEDEKKRQEEFLNAQIDALERELKEEEIMLLDSAKTKEEIELDLLAKKADILKQEIDLKQKANEDAIDQELELAQLEAEIREKKLEAEKKAEEEKKKQREEDFKELQDFQKRVTELTFQRIQEETQNNINEYERQVDLQEDNVERQRRLAEQGLENTLAFEKQIQAEKEAQLLQEQKRLEKIKKVEAYYNLLAAYAQDDPNSAPAKALVQIGIAEAIAGKFEDGGIVAEEVAKQNGGILKGASHRRGGILIEAEGDEGIFSKKEMRNLGRDNFHALKSALNKPSEINFARKQSDNLMGISQVKSVSLDLSDLKSDLKRIESAIENKPVPSFNIDRDGNMITKEQTKKLIKTTVQKRGRI